MSSTNFMKFQFRRCIKYAFDINYLIDSQWLWRGYVQHNQIPKGKRGIITLTEFGFVLLPWWVLGSRLWTDEERKGLTIQVENLTICKTVTSFKYMRFKKETISLRKNDTWRERVLQGLLTICVYLHTQIVMKCK